MFSPYCNSLANAAKKKNQNLWFAPQFNIAMADRETLVSYLKGHFRYYTMNAWNRSTSYANNVKVHNLDLDGRFGKETLDRAYDIVCDPELDTFEMDLEIEHIMKGFANDTGYAMGVNGRSGGYLVMYDTKRDDDGSVSVMPGRSVDWNCDFDDEDEWDLESLRERARLVAKFDAACDEIVAAFAMYAHKGTIETTTEMVEVECRRLTIDGGDA